MANSDVEPIEMFREGALASLLRLQWFIHMLSLQIGQPADCNNTCASYFDSYHAAATNTTYNAQTYKLHTASSHLVAHSCSNRD